MASLDDVINVIRSAIPTYAGFADKSEILNTYSLEDNPSKFMENAWGIRIGSGSRAASDEPVIDEWVSTERSITVVISRAIYDVRGIGLQANEQAKALLADARTIRDNFLGSSKFGVLKSGEQITYLGDSGINFLGGTEGKFIFTEIDFNLEIIEQLT